MISNVKSNVGIFNLLVISLITLAILTQYLLNFSDLYYQALANDLSTLQIREFTELRNKWQWLGFFILPILLLIKISVLSTILYIGLFIFNRDIEYKNLFRVVTKAEFLVVLVGIVKLLWLFSQDNINLEDVQYFSPLSALSIIGYEDLAPWFIYPFQVLNLFELAYWFILAFLLAKELKSTMDEGFKIVACSYGPALLIWVVAVMFFTLNVS